MMHLRITLFTLSLSLSLSLSFSLSFFIFLSLSLSLSVYLSVYLRVCLSVCLYLSLYVSSLILSRVVDFLLPPICSLKYLSQLLAVIIRVSVRLATGRPFSGASYLQAVETWYGQVDRAALVPVGLGQTILQTQACYR